MGALTMTRWFHRRALPWTCALVLGASVPLTAWAQGEMMYQGIAKPSREVVLTAPVQAVLGAVTVEEDAPVISGQAVAKMDEALQLVSVLAARLKAESETEILSKTLALKEAQITYERSKDALAAAAASDWEVRKAELQRDQAAAEVKAAEENHRIAQVELQLEEERLTRYTLTAPFDGRVFRIEVDPGATLSPGDKILTLRKLDPLEAQVYLPVRLYGKMKVGQSYQLDAGEPVSKPLTATLKTIDRDIDTASRTFRCVFTITNPDSQLPSGFMVRLQEPEQAGLSQAPPEAH
jgi:RND family efflux transporter MFP subunit